MLGASVRERPLRAEDLMPAELQHDILSRVREMIGAAKSRIVACEAALEEAQAVFKAAKGAHADPLRARANARGVSQVGAEDIERMAAVHGAGLLVRRRVAQLMAARVRLRDLELLERQAQRGARQAAAAVVALWEKQMPIAGQPAMGDPDAVRRGMAGLGFMALENVSNGIGRALKLEDRKRQREAARMARALGQEVEEVKDDDAG